MNIFIEAQVIALIIVIINDIDVNNVFLMIASIIITSFLNELCAVALYTAVNLLVNNISSDTITENINIDQIIAIIINAIKFSLVAKTVK